MKRWDWSQIDQNEVLKDSYYMTSSMIAFVSKIILF